MCSSGDEVGGHDEKRGRALSVGASGDSHVVGSVGHNWGDGEINFGGPWSGFNLGVVGRVLVENLSAEDGASEVDMVKIKRIEPDTSKVEHFSDASLDGAGLTVGKRGVHDEVIKWGCLNNVEIVGESTDGSGLNKSRCLHLFKKLIIIGRYMTSFK